MLHCVSMQHQHMSANDEEHAMCDLDPRPVVSGSPKRMTSSMYCSAAASLL